MEVSVKNTIRLTLCLALLLTTLTSNVSNAYNPSDYTIYLDGEEIVFDVPPLEVNNRLLVPVRAISEATGATVTWDGSTAKVDRDGDVLELRIETYVALYNDVPLTMDVAPMLRNQRILLPLRFVSEWLGLQVNQQGSAVWMSALQSLPNDTVLAPRGNTNGNMLASANIIIWQNRLYHVAPGTWNVISTDMETGVVSSLGSFGHAGISNLQVWEDGLYFNYWGGDTHYRFVQIDAQGNILRTLSEDARSAQIYDGWLYYLKTNPSGTGFRLHRQSMVGGDEQFLGLSSYGGYFFVISDQHLYVASEGALLRMNHDGTNRIRLIEMADRIVSMELVNGMLMFSTGHDYSETGAIYQINTDGTGLRLIRDENAYIMNYHDGWLYYSTRTVPQYGEGSHLGPGPPSWPPRAIRRVSPDGATVETLVETMDDEIMYLYPTILSDGNLYYYHHNFTRQQQAWVVVDLKTTQENG